MSCTCGSASIAVFVDVRRRLGCLPGLLTLPVPKVLLRAAAEEPALALFLPNLWALVRLTLGPGDCGDTSIGPCWTG
jgi:hypothetical protein